LLRRATECSRYCNLLERSSRNDEKNEEIASASYGVQRYCKLKKSSSRNDEKNEEIASASYGVWQVMISKGTLSSQ